MALEEDDFVLGNECKIANASVLCSANDLFSNSKHYIATKLPCAPVFQKPQQHNFTYFDRSNNSIQGQHAENSSYTKRMLHLH